MSIPSPQAGFATLVTGASSGIGAELARQMAARGHDLIIVARRLDRLELLASELRTEFGRRVEPVSCDLADADARDELNREINATGLKLDVLMLCAGFGLGGPFLDHDPAQIVQMTRTNLEAPVSLCRSLLPAIVDRRRGAVLLVSSIAGNQPMPNFSAYAATKAAVTSFAEAISCELASSGISVTVLCPGEVSTEFSAAASMEHQASQLPAALKAGPEEVGREAIRALERGQRVVTPRPAVRAFTYLVSHLPRAIWLPICRKLLAPGA